MGKARHEAATGTDEGAAFAPRATSRSGVHATGVLHGDARTREALRTMARTSDEDALADAPMAMPLAEEETRIRQVSQVLAEADAELDALAMEIGGGSAGDEERAAAQQGAVGDVHAHESAPDSAGIGGEAHSHPQEGDHANAHADEHDLENPLGLPPAHVPGTAAAHAHDHADEREEAFVHLGGRREVGGRRELALDVREPDEPAEDLARVEGVLGAVAGGAMPSFSPGPAKRIRVWSWICGCVALALAASAGLALAARRVGPPALPLPAPLMRHADMSESSRQAGVVSTRSEFASATSVSARPTVASASPPSGAVASPPSGSVASPPPEPVSSAARLKNAELAIGAGKPGAARELLVAVTAHDVTNPHVFAALAQAELMLGAPERALLAAEAAARLRPRRARYQWLIAHIYDVLGAQQEAEDARMRAELLVPYDPDSRRAARSNKPQESAAAELPADAEE